MECAVPSALTTEISSCMLSRVDPASCMHALVGRGVKEPGSALLPSDLAAEVATNGERSER